MATLTNVYIDDWTADYLLASSSMQLIRTYKQAVFHYHVQHIGAYQQTAKDPTASIPRPYHCHPIK